MKKQLFACCLLLVSLVALGQSGPPAEAFAACSGRNERTACQFSAPHGLLQGECRTMREGRPVCVPAGGGQNAPRQERPEGAGKRFGADIAATNPRAIAVVSRVPDTGQGSCFDTGNVIPCPAAGAPLFGQDASYEGAPPAYRDNGDGTIGDLITGLTWQQSLSPHRQRRRSLFTNAKTLPAAVSPPRGRLTTLSVMVSMTEPRRSSSSATAGRFVRTSVSVGTALFCAPAVIHRWRQWG